MKEVKKEDRPEIDFRPAPLAIKAATESTIATVEYVPGENEERPEPRTTSVYTSMTRKLKEEKPKKSEAEVRVTDKDEVDKGRGVSFRFLS